MTLIVGIKSPYGIVMSGDNMMYKKGPKPEAADEPQTWFHSTTGNKLLSIPGQPFIIVGFSGGMILGSTSISLIVARFGQQLLARGQSPSPVKDVAQQLKNFMTPFRHPENGTTYALMGGLDPQDGEGRLFKFEVPSSGDVEELESPKRFFWDRIGVHDRFDKMVDGVNPEFDSMSLLDCVTLATAVIKTVGILESMTCRVPQIGGSVDVATVTYPEGTKWVRRELGY